LKVVACDDRKDFRFMSRKMLINATHPEENRVAIVADGILTELDIEVVGREQTKGNIYKAAVVRVEPGLQAAFVDYGAERPGFLQMGEIHPSLFKAADPDGSRKGKLRINDVLRRGQEILVQITKGERGTKGAALTTHLSLAGRYMVLMPESDSKGISRKIENESERKKLKKTMDSLGLPENMGFIVRTAGIDQSPEELKRDFDYLVRVYDNILAHGKKVKAPALIYKESNLVIRSIRDYFTPDIDEVLVDDPKVLQEAKEFFQQVMPECVKLVKLHTEKRPIFSRYQIEEQIETISKNKVSLPSGGSIVIDRTEALVAIDVNSGKMSGEQGIEATAFKTNLEAAEEVGRQLRLRDLGGLIVVDFIDMRERKHGREVEKTLKDALKHDKAKTSVGKISSFGMLEMSRQRIKDALAEWSFLPCPHCEGTGRVKSPEAQAVAVLRKLQAGIAKGQIAKIEGEVPLDVATYLLNGKRHELVEMEQQHQLEIVLRGRADLIAGQVELTFVRREKEDDLYLPPVTALFDANEMRAVAEPAHSAPNPVKTDAGPATDESKAKRGRNRRKKVGNDPETSETLPATAEVAVAEPATTEIPVETATADNLSALVGEDGKRKRKRRRRKKKSGGGEQGEMQTGDGKETTSAAAEPAALAAAEMPASEDATGRKKRKRRRKKKSGGGSEAQGSASVATTTAGSEAPPATTEAQTGASKPSTPRRRNRTQAAAAAEAARQESVATENPGEKAPGRGRRQPKTPAPAAIEAATEAPKRASRSRKSTPQEQTGEQTAPDGTATAAKKRNSRRKPPAPADGEA
jgi:ribonuclease E